MGNRRITVLAAALTIAALAGIGATGDELPSKDHPLPEPFPALFHSDTSPTASEKVDDRYTTGDQRAQTPPAAVSPDLQSKLLREEIAINDMGDPKQLIFQGVTLFPEEVLRQALASDLRYQVAARPANDALHFAATLTERLTEGYWSSGCQKAIVRVGRSQTRQAMIVQVDEGPRYQKGEIIIEAPSAIDKDQLTKWLTTAHTPPTWHVEYDRELPSVDSDTVAWRAGDAVDYTTAGLESLRSSVKWALVEQGIPHATFWVDRERHTRPDVADLTIRVIGDATPSSVKKIEIEGLKRDSRERLLKYLELAEGDRFDAALVERIGARLKHSCRYWTTDITAKFGEPHATYSAGATLLLKLHEYEPMPPIDEPLAAADEILRKAAESVAGDGKTPPAEIVFSARLKSINGAPQELQVVRGAFSVRRGLALELKLPDGSPVSVDHSLIIEPHQIDVFDWRLLRKIALPAPQRLTLQLAQNQGFDNAGKFDQNLCLSCAANMHGKTASAAQNAWQIRVEPVGLLHMAHRPGAQTRIHDGRLTLSSGDGTKSEADFDAATGRLLCLRLFGGENTSKWSADVDFEPGKFDDVTNAIRNRGREIADSFDLKHPTASTISFVLGEVEAQPALDAKLRRCCDLAKFFQTLPCCQRQFEKMDSKLAEARAGGGDLIAGSSRNFTIPGSQLKDDDEWATLSRSILHSVISMADEAFPRGSWPWVTVREVACIHVKDEIDEAHEQTTELIGKEFAKMASRSDSGPLGTALFVKALQSDSMGIGATDFGAGVAAATLRDLSDDAFARDIRLLVEGNEGLGIISREAADSLGKMSDEEQRRVIAAMPTCLQEPLTRVAARRKQVPGEPPAESIKVSLLDSWHHGLRETVATELQRTSANSARKWLDSTETARKDSPTKSQ